MWIDIFIKVFAALGAIGAIVGLIVGVASLYDRWKEPEIDLHTVRIYYIRDASEPDTYQIGLLAEVANRDAKSYRIDGLAVNPRSVDVGGRGQTFIRHIWGNFAGTTENDYHLEPNKLEYFRIKLPLYFEMKIAHPPTPEILFFGDWRLTVNGKSRTVVPARVGTVEAAISNEQWRTIYDGKGALLDDPVLKTAPSYTELKGPDKNYLIYNSDRSARLDLYAFSNTVIVKSENGQMTFIRGPGTPRLPSGWKILGHTYQEVWANPKYLTLYDSIFPASQDGRPHPFGVFAGVESEMGVSESVPTTRGQDILRVYPNPTNPTQRTINIDLSAGIRYLTDPFAGQ